MLPSFKKEDMSLKVPGDERYQTIDDILKSPLKSPMKKIEKIHTKLGDLRFFYGWI